MKAFGVVPDGKVEVVQPAHVAGSNHDARRAINRSRAPNPILQRRGPITWFP